MAKARKRITLEEAYRVVSAHLNKTRKKTLSPERRREIAVAAVSARWAKRDAQRAAAAKQAGSLQEKAS